MQPCGLQNPVEAADILAAHGDHWGALTLLEDRLRSPTHPDEPAAWALKPAEAQRLHSLWMKLGTPETCTKVSLQISFSCVSGRLMLLSLAEEI